MLIIFTHFISERVKFCKLSYAFEITNYVNGSLCAIKEKSEYSYC